MNIPTNKECSGYHSSVQMVQMVSGDMCEYTEYLRWPRQDRWEEAAGMLVDLPTSQCKNQMQHGATLDLVISCCFLIIPEVEKTEGLE